MSYVLNTFPAEITRGKGTIAMMRKASMKIMKAPTPLPGIKLVNTRGFFKLILTLLITDFCILILEKIVFKIRDKGFKVKSSRFFRRRKN